jgi:hypothetical protein
MAKKRGRPPKKAVTSEVTETQPTEDTNLKGFNVRKVVEKTVEKAPVPETEEVTQETTEQSDDILIGTSKEIFPDLNDLYKEEAGIAVEEAPQSEQTETETETQATEETKPTEEAEETQEETQPSPFDLESNKDAMVEVNIGGEKKMVTLEEAIKGYQTDQFLTKKGQTIAEDKKYIQEIEAKLKETVKPQAPLEEEEEFVDARAGKEIANLKGQLNQITDYLGNLTENLKPTIINTEHTKVAKALAEEGFTDYSDYQPRIDDAINSMSPELRKEYDTIQGKTALYRDLKLRDFQKGVIKPKEQPVKPEKKQVKVVPVVESGGGASAADDGYASKYKAAYEKAQETGNWDELIRLKGYQ